MSRVWGCGGQRGVGGTNRGSLEVLAFVLDQTERKTRVHVLNRIGACLLL